SSYGAAVGGTSARLRSGRAATAIPPPGLFTGGFSVMCIVAVGSVLTRTSINSRTFHWCFKKASPDRVVVVFPTASSRLPDRQLAAADHDPSMHIIFAALLAGLMATPHCAGMCG